MKDFRTLGLARRLPDLLAARVLVVNIACAAEKFKKLL